VFPNICGTVLSVYHLIKRMPSFVLNSKIHFSTLYPNKSVFSMTSRVFDYTCFVQDLSPRLDKLSPRCIKYVFIGYSKTQKIYQCYNSSTRKYCLRMSHSLSLFHIVHHIILLLPLKLFFYYMCHYLHCFCLFFACATSRHFRAACVKINSGFQICLHSSSKGSCL